MNGLELFFEEGVLDEEFVEDIVMELDFFGDEDDVLVL